MPSYYNNDGAAWVVGAAGADRYPTDGVGGGTATPANSILVGAVGGGPAAVVEIMGIYVATLAAVNVEVIWHDGSSATVVPGHTFSASAVGAIDFPATRIQHTKAAGVGNCNIGIRCGAGAVATLYYRRLE